MIFSELCKVHDMLTEKTSGFKYLYEWMKILNPPSWRIFHMVNIDQKEWRRIKKSVDQKMSRREDDLEEYITIDNIQKLNTERLKKIINKNGCITVSRFGMIASHSAWLIAQHSDHDREFQKKYLKLMKENKKDVFLENIESLTRRLIV